ncbi:MAG: biotin--[acetyl-CoA-carboxylase] ligase [Candidatus Omnitrophica bacterium]|nr:biotin--[acetyl-CoA-carboxylase] ligase [Candidatus Omnitrophota bacterium]
MQDKILDLLKKKQEYVSGEDISQHLKISRQALWKHIHHLKEAGYNIVAVPHLGYKLVSSPDRLFVSEITSKLHTKFIGKKIYYFDEISSTMDVATDLGLKGAPEGTLVIAEAQTKGRGRLGRGWSSPKYKGIYASFILRPKISPQNAAILTLLTAVGICEAIREITGLEAKIKWPNDIMICDKKLGGILTELSAETDEIRFVVVGIGINVNNNKNSLIPHAVSLKEQKGQSYSRTEILQEILRKIETNYLLLQEKGSRKIIDKWRLHNISLGSRVKVSCQGREVEGQAVDIDIDGGLLVRKDSGLTEKVTSGDVTACR